MLEELTLEKFDPKNYLQKPGEDLDPYPVSEGVRISLQSPYVPSVVDSGDVEYYYTVPLVCRPLDLDDGEVFVIEAEDFLGDLESELAEHPEYKDFWLRFRYMRFYSGDLEEERELEPVLYQPQSNRFYFKVQLSGYEE